MRISLNQNTGDRQIESYSTGEIVINEQHYQQPAIVSEAGVQDWPVQNVNNLTKEHMQILVDTRVEIMIIGTGKFQHFLSPVLLHPLVKAKMGVEIMDTAAACRTYNVLLSESRSVAAALFMIEA